MYPQSAAEWPSAVQGAGKAPIRRTAPGRSCPFTAGWRYDTQRLFAGWAGFPRPGPAIVIATEGTGARGPLQVLVRDNNVDQALRALKKKMQREGIFREMKMRRNYEKPSERRARERAEAVRRYRKLMRKRMDREGY